MCIRDSCSGVFLDVSQAFDKVWHLGLLYKIKKNLPHNCYRILHSYIQWAECFKSSSLMLLLLYYQWGQVFRSVVSWVLCSTSDLPSASETTVATYADDTAILATHSDPSIASLILQESLNNVQLWLDKWRIKINSSKSVQSTYTASWKC